MGSDTGRPNLIVMFLVHRVFREEFAALAREAAGVHDADRAQALEEQLGLVLRTLHEHHTGEDTLIWPLVLKRAPESKPVLDSMEAEHGELDPLITTAGDTSLSLKERADTLQRLSERLNAHLDREEREALPLLERHVPADEYAALDKIMTKRVGKDLPAFAGAVMWHATPEERDRLLSSVPRILGIMWRLSWRRQYARRVARTYGRPGAVALAGQRSAG
jgi:iron-sulfur cluster repair protein YtfE (RIC family)